LKTDASKVINIVITLGMEKPEWCGYPMMKKIEGTLIRFDSIHERAGWTDSALRHRRRICSTARQKMQTVTTHPSRVLPECIRCKYYDTFM